MSSDLLSLVGLAKKAGKLEVGEEPVGTVARSGHAKLIIVAADAAENSRRRASHFADAGRVKWLSVPFTKAELGGILGRSSCAMAAFTDMGFAASLAAKLAIADPEQYGEAAAQLDGKAQKVLQRQKEQRVHEKRIREGKSKPWSPPAKPTNPVAASAAEPRANSLRSGDQSKAAGSPRGVKPRGVVKITVKKK